MLRRGVVLSVGLIVAFSLRAENPAMQVTAQQPAQTNHYSVPVVYQAVPPDTDTSPVVLIRNFAFRPTELTVKVGTTVTWLELDGFAGAIGPHNVRAVDNSFTSGPCLGTETSGCIAKGDSWAFTFNATGTFDYLCDPHPSAMRASITVVD